MYTPSAFAEDDPAVLARIIADHPFAVIVTAGADGPQATHLPFLLDGPAAPGGRLIAHMAKANPHAGAFDGKTPALVIFSGAHAYVSPRWYADERNVPTWNYEAVHVTGPPRIIAEAAAARDCLERLTAAMEAGAPGPWSMADADAGYIAGRLKGITAFEVPIARIEGKRKMGQNKSAPDRRAAAEALMAHDDPMCRAVGLMMADPDVGSQAL